MYLRLFSLKFILFILGKKICKKIDYTKNTMLKYLIDLDIQQSLVSVHRQLSAESCMYLLSSRMEFYISNVESDYQSCL